MAQTVTLLFNGPPFKRQAFPLYGGKLDVGVVKAEFGLQWVHVDNLPLGIDPQGLSGEEFQPGAVIRITGTMAADLNDLVRQLLPRLKTLLAKDAAEHSGSGQSSARRRHVKQKFQHMLTIIEESSSGGVSCDSITGI